MISLTQKKVRRKRKEKKKEWEEKKCKRKRKKDFTFYFYCFLIFRLFSEGEKIREGRSIKRYDPPTQTSNLNSYLILRLNQKADQSKGTILFFVRAFCTVLL